MNLTLQIAFTASIQIPHKFSTTADDDSYNQVTDWLMRAQRLQSTIDSMYERLPSNHDGSFDSLWAVIKCNCDFTFNKGRMVDVEQAVSHAFDVRGITYDKDCAFDVLVRETLMSVTYFYCEGVSS